jgi:hypothetical protein
MKCPKCGLINADSALRCDCGYDFETGLVKESFIKKPALHQSVSVSNRSGAPDAASDKKLLLGQLASHTQGTPAEYMQGLMRELLEEQRMQTRLLNSIDTLIRAVALLLIFSTLAGGVVYFLTAVGLIAVGQ